MENDQDSSLLTTNRPSIGFPLGLALLLLMLFCMSGFFTCCLHWNKIRSLMRPFVDDDHMNVHRVPYKVSPLHMKSGQNRMQSLLVSMPGDHVPKFVAMACPCKPPIVEKLPVTLHETMHSVNA